jgi:hypothetical protein
MKIIWSFLLCFAFLTTEGHAQGFIETPDGLLDDDAFFNVVVCGVTPQETCASEPLKWSKEKARHLTIKVAVKGANRNYQKSVNAALDQAIANINAVEPKLQLHRSGKGRAEITLFITNLKAGDSIKGTKSDLDDTEIEGAAVNIEWNNKSELRRATIVMAGDLGADELRSIMLEELTQALGPINDIRNKAYEGVSIFSEDSNAQTTLGRQDIMVLRRLYE